MKTINTTLRHGDSMENIAIKIDHSNAFCSVFNLGMVLSSKDPSTKEFATDETGLHIVKEQLEYLQDECSSGLSGIGALLSTANPVNLVSIDLENVGYLIKCLTKLIVEAKDHLQEVNNQIADKANPITDPKQAAYHAQVHRDALKIKQSQSVDYADAVLVAAGRLAVRQDDVDSKQASTKKRQA